MGCLGISCVVPLNVKGCFFMREGRGSCWQFLLVLGIEMSLPVYPHTNDGSRVNFSDVLWPDGPCLGFRKDGLALCWEMAWSDYSRFAIASLTGGWTFHVLFFLDKEIFCWAHC